MSSEQSQQSAGSKRDLPFVDKAFPLKRHFIIYGGLLAIVFYSVLGFLIFEVSREALWTQHLQAARTRADFIYHDISRDFLVPRQLSLVTIDPEDIGTRQQLRDEVIGIVGGAGVLAHVKIIRVDGIVLFDSTEVSNEGKLYPDHDEESFQSALKGGESFTTEAGPDGVMLMEIYLPVRNSETDNIEGILELYEPITGFHEFLQRTMLLVLGLPTLILIVFSGLLYRVVSMADRNISSNTALLRRVRDQMAQFLPDSALRAVWQAGHTDQVVGEGERREMTVFFTDVRGFTTYSEQNAPERVVEQLNELFNLQARIIYQCGGWIDKFIGDEIFAVFDSADDAVTAGAEIIRALAELGMMDFRIGVGIHCGPAIVGALGTENRRDYSVIGDVVNTGARLCARAEAGEILVSGQLHDQLSAPLAGKFSQAKELSLKGKEGFVATRSWFPA